LHCHGAGRHPAPAEPRQQRPFVKNIVIREAGMVLRGAPVAVAALSAAVRTAWWIMPANAQRLRRQHARDRRILARIDIQIDIHPASLETIL